LAKRLYRSNRERILGGVSGGLAEYFDVDVTLIRLAWVLLAFTGGAGLPAYIIAWIIIPEGPRFRKRDLAAGGESDDDEMVEPHPDDGDGAAQAHPVENRHDHDGGHRSDQSGYRLFGLILVVVGFALLVDKFLPWFRVLWPALLIIAGILVIAGVFRR